MVSISQFGGITFSGHPAPFSLVLPESFEPGEFLKSPDLLSRFDDARYFLNLILTKLARQDVDDRGLVRLMAKHLKCVMHCGTYAAVIRALRKGKAIERFPYSPGSRSFGFRLGTRFVADKHIRVPATDRRLIRRLEKFHNQTAAEREARMLPVHRELAKRQTRLQIHGTDARRTLASLPAESNPFDVQGFHVSKIENGEFYFNVGRFGRVSNSITSLKRELRSTLHVDGEPLASVDLSCAQPALLAKLINDIRDGKATPKDGTGTKQCKYDSSFGADFDQYVSLVQTGRFYDFMVERLRDDEISRDEFKPLFLRDVIAKKGRYPSKVENAFRKAFPSVYRFIEFVNRQDHANLIRLLQQEESGFVIGIVAADFVDRHPTWFVIPLHDALYTTRRNLRAVQQSFDRGFRRTGFRMQLKVET